jgi:hypothetical protein
MDIDKLASIYVALAIGTEITDPVTDALNKAKLGPATLDKRLLMPVLQEMATQGVAPGIRFDIGLVIPQNKIPQYSVTPKNNAVASIMQQKFSPLIRKAIANIAVSKPWVANSWIRDLYWEEG